MTVYLPRYKGFKNKHIKGKKIKITEIKAYPANLEPFLFVNFFNGKIIEKIFKPWHSRHFSNKANVKYGRICTNRAEARQETAVLPLSNIPIAVWATPATLKRIILPFFICKKVI